MIWSVDLRNRADGNSVETILITNDYDAAWNLERLWNLKHIPNFDEELSADMYCCHAEDVGLVADVYEGGYVC